MRGNRSSCIIYLYVKLILVSSSWGMTCRETQKGYEQKKTQRGTWQSSSAHQHYNSFMQGAACFEGLLPTVIGVLPLQTVFDKLLGFSILTFCIQYEVSSHLILHSCGEWGEKDIMCVWSEKNVWTSCCAQRKLFEIWKTLDKRNSRIERTRLRMDFEMLGCGMFSLLPTCW